jgi:hypothetical protein
MEGDAMVGLAQERLACDLGREHARLAFDTELALESAVACSYANDRLGEVSVEIVTDDVPPGVEGTATQQPAERSRENPSPSGCWYRRRDRASASANSGPDVA